MSASFLRAADARASDAASSCAHTTDTPSIRASDALPAIAQFWREQRHAAAPQVLGHTRFRVCFSDERDAGELMREARVAIILRGQYAEATHVPSSASGIHHVEFEAVLPSPAVLNEVRVRAVVRGGARAVSAFTVWGATPRDPAARLDSPWVKEEVVDAEVTSWSLLVEHREYTGDDLEVRCFVLCNVPRVPSCSASLRDALLAMDDFGSAWDAALAGGDCTPLSLTLARLLLEERSKLRSFLEKPAVRLRAWPGKGGVQQLVVLWMCVQLVAEHEYTEPELYAHVSDLCASSPDHAVIRKEMVRHGYLSQPVIRQNADRTTSTTYTVDAAAVAAAMRSELLGALARPAAQGGKGKR